MCSRAVVWFRNDLRLEANPAWATATREFDEVLPVVVVDRRLLDSVGDFRRNQWVADVAALRGELRSLGGDLVVVHGDAFEALAPVCAGADAIFTNSATSRWGRVRDERAFAALGIRSVAFWGTLVTDPGSVLTAKGTLSRVFTPFFRRWSATPLGELPEPGDASLVSRESGELPEAGAPPRSPGNAGAHEVLEEWLQHVDSYESTRDIPSIPGTSQLSAALRFGTIAPRTVLDLVGSHTTGRAAFVRQLAWRDWYAHLLVENPTMTTAALRADYDRINWNESAADLAAWQEGRTGYPLVDAGMRQLRQTGWMHNRVRMVTASFLVKDLLIDWRHGERWFRHLLVDGEPSQNAGNWQWVAGTGADAAPYFRVFNPVTQSEKFDPEGVYIRRWVPELAGLEGRAVHAPWTLGPLELAAAGVVLGESYPGPMVDHAEARDRALEAYRTALGSD